MSDDIVSLTPPPAMSHQSRFFSSDGPDGKTVFQINPDVNGRVSITLDALIFLINAKYLEEVPNPYMKQP